VFSMILLVVPAVEADENQLNEVQTLIRSMHGLHRLAPERQAILQKIVNNPKAYLPSIEEAAGKCLAGGNYKSMGVIAELLQRIGTEEARLLLHQLYRKLVDSESNVPKSELQSIILTENSLLVFMEIKADDKMVEYFVRQYPNRSPSERSAIEGCLIRSAKKNAALLDSLASASSRVKQQASDGNSDDLLKVVMEKTRSQ
ncbi:MAG: hypothetical protein MN733_35605, partial [Nitrososphaera sp.]|nr:hypothetical protein [Nitrososphaera sp.]